MFCNCSFETGTFRCLVVLVHQLQCLSECHFFERSGRRGKDARGIVIMMIDEKVQHENDSVCFVVSYVEFEWSVCCDIDGSGCKCFVCEFCCFFLTWPRCAAMYVCLFRCVCCLFGVSSRCVLFYVCCWPLLWCCAFVTEACKSMIHGEADPLTSRFYLGYGRYTSTTNDGLTNWRRFVVLIGCWLAVTTWCWICCVSRRSTPSSWFAYVFNSSMFWNCYRTKCVVKNIRFLR